MSQPTICMARSIIQCQTKFPTILSKVSHTHIEETKKFAYFVHVNKQKRPWQEKHTLTCSILYLSKKHALKLHYRRFLKKYSFLLCPNFILYPKYFSNLIDKFDTGDLLKIIFHSSTNSFRGISYRLI